jgi:hypothetical protein
MGRIQIEVVELGTGRFCGCSRTEDWEGRQDRHMEAKDYLPEFCGQCGKRGQGLF